MVVALLSHVLRVVVHDACTQYKGSEQRSALLSVTILPLAHGLRCTHALNTVLVHWRIQYRQTYLRSKQATQPTLATHFDSISNVNDGSRGRILVCRPAEGVYRAHRRRSPAPRLRASLSKLTAAAAA